LRIPKPPSVVPEEYDAAMIVAYQLALTKMEMTDVSRS
jgi:hypothetical protein